MIEVLQVFLFFFMAGLPAYLLSRKLKKTNLSSSTKFLSVIVVGNLTLLIGLVVWTLVDALIRQQDFVNNLGLQDKSWQLVASPMLVLGTTSSVIAYLLVVPSENRDSPND